MSHSSFLNILILPKLSSLNHKQQATAQELAATKSHLNASVSTVPDNKEYLAEEQKDWCQEWYTTLVSGNVSNPLPDTESIPQNVVHTAMSCAHDSSLTSLLNKDLKCKTHDANALFVQWQDHPKEVAAHAASAWSKKAFELMVLLCLLQDSRLPGMPSKVTKSYSESIPSTSNTSTPIKYKVSDLVVFCIMPTYLSLACSLYLGQ